MSIFTVEKREEVKIKLLDVGIELIKEKGIKQMTVSEVTKRTGIGKGTFYHFYKAKEWYVYDVIEYSKEELKQTFNRIAENPNGVDRTILDEILHQYSFLGTNNIIYYITPEDEAWLREKLPQEMTLNVPKEDEIIAAFLGHLKGINPKVNGHVVANMMKIMALAAEQRTSLHQEALDENFGLMRTQLLDYLFETR